MEVIRPEVQEQIERIMTELEKYLQNTNKFDWISILGILASLFIGGVAIYISIKTSKRQEELMKHQNEIALFEERIIVYHELQNIGTMLNEYDGSYESINKILNINFLLKYNNYKLPIKSIDMARIVSSIFKNIKNIDFLFNNDINSQYSNLKEAYNDFQRMLNGYIANNDYSLIDSVQIEDVKLLSEKLSCSIEEQLKLQSGRL